MLMVRIVATGNGLSTAVLTLARLSGPTARAERRVWRGKQHPTATSVCPTSGGGVDVGLQFVQVRDVAAAVEHDPRLGETSGGHGAGNPRSCRRGCRRGSAGDRRRGSGVRLVGRRSAVEGDEAALAAGAAGRAPGGLLLPRADRAFRGGDEFPRDLQ